MLRRLARRPLTPKKQAVEYDESYYLAPQWQLIWRKFRRHRLAIVSALVITLLYSMAIFPEFYSVKRSPEAPRQICQGATAHSSIP